MEDKYSKEYHDKIEKFNWEHALYFNKEDGTCIKVYYDGKKWCSATNGTAFAEGETPMGKSFAELFIEAIGMDLQIAFKNCMKSHTYIFELTSPENRIVTRYTETKAILLAVRNNQSGMYLDYNTFKGLSFAPLVKSYKLNHDNLIKFVENRDQMDEGIVCYDPLTDIRIKVKNSSYVAIHHLKSNEVTKKSLIGLLLKGEEDEYLTYFPEDKDIIQPYIKRYHQLKNDILNTYEKYKDIKDQKEFALKVKDLEYNSILFSLRKGVKLNDIFTIDRLTYFIKFF